MKTESTNLLLLTNSAFCLLELILVARGHLDELR